ncbi:MAG: sigma 54-interacting transcriptional regulator [Firmicutes bacterium]|nr:sigma 54-interacting transcriptional regulator [Bacillota bacterium]
MALAEIIHHPLTYDEIRQKWLDLQKDPELRKRVLPPEILDSWERSSQYKIPRFTRENANFCTEAELREAQEKSRYLMEISLPVMESLQEFVAGTGFVVCLIDANAVALKALGDQESLDWAKGANLVRGSLWAEELIGTNAGTLSVSLARPISVYAYEYYCLFAIVSAASFCPIIDNGCVIGSIGMTARFERVSNHTLGMVVAAAKHIESKMVLDRVSKYHQVVMESMSDGVMVVDSNGTVTYMNKNCLKMLGLGNTSPVGCKIYELLGNNGDNQYFVNIVTQGRTVTDEFIVLTNGKTQIRCNITCTPLNSPNPYGAGSVIIIRENERINHIVGKWIGRSAKMTFSDIVGGNSKFQQVINMAKSASSSNSNVLLLGESGTGKDIIAQAMHNESPRKNNPFVAINCAALPRELIASELFGYEDGAFTGAKKGGNIGKFELANQGTIFLDEIGDVPLDLQVALLRVLEEKSVIRLGGTKLIPVNVRIIAATNKNLEEEIARNRFRRDLYYRLGVIRLNIPPLRERPEDIPCLVEHFLRVICQRFDKPVKKLTPGTIEALTNYPWPGNIRELQNVLEGAVQLADSDEITFDYLKEYLHLEAQVEHPSVNDRRDASLTVVDVERQMIADYLKKHDYNKNETAKALGMSRRTFYRRLHKYGLL